MANTTVSKRQLSVVYLPYRFPDELYLQHTRSEMLQIRHELILRRGYVKRLVVGDSPDYGSVGGSIWQAALCHVANLTALELDTVAIEHRPTDRIADVVRAAMRHSPALKKLTTPRVRVQHPSLQLRGLVRGYDDAFGVMERMTEFAVATGAAQLPSWTQRMFTCENDEIIDTVFVNRVVRDDVDDDSGSRSDSESSDDEQNSERDSSNEDSMN